MLISSRRPILSSRNSQRRPAMVLAAGFLAAGAGLASLQAYAGGDAENGKKVVMQCMVCHTVVAGKNGIGPSLAGVVGRKAGTAPGFKYSDALTAAGAGGLTWDEKSLERWLEDPKSVVPGNKMTFAGLKKEQDRDDAIAFLKTKTQ